MKRHVASCIRSDPRTITRGGKRKVKDTKFAHSVVIDFFCRDDNSRNSSGKKQTKTFKGEKKQKRFLLFSIDTLYMKFVSEYGHVISRYSIIEHYLTAPSHINITVGSFCAIISLYFIRSAFYRLRPFFVVRPELNDRETCMCTMCTNTQLMVDAAFAKSLVSSRTLEVLVQKIVCSDSSFKCVQRECEECCNRIVHCTSNLGEYEVTYFQWISVKKENGFKSTECIQVSQDIMNKVTMYSIYCTCMFVNINVIAYIKIIL
jgi:hypothetical protein